jgi:flagellar P-ring protein precursor FlgI
MNHRRWRIAGTAAALALALALADARAAHAARIKDIADFQGVRSNALVGYGIVVGLSGTGDDNLEYTLQSVRSAAQRLGVTIAPGARASLKDSAAVMLTAELPPFAKPGQRIDVEVAAIGKAKSLRGGTLMLAQLQGADGQTYAIAQGSLAVGGLGVEGHDGSKVTINIPSSGRIPDGATVERAVETGFAGGAGLTLNLKRADFTDAMHVARAIDRLLGPGAARVQDAVSILIPAAPDPAARIGLMARIEGLDIATDMPPARVIVNARTGTIVIGGGVRVSPAAVAHGNLIVRIAEDLEVSQPAPLSPGKTAIVPHSSISVEQEPARMFLFNPGVELTDIVDAVNRVGASPSDLVAILEALKQAGALKAELIVI